MTPLLRPLPVLLSLAFSGALGCQRFAPPPADEPVVPVDTQDSLSGLSCGTATVGPYVTAVTHEAATVVLRSDAACRPTIEIARSGDFVEIVQQQRATGGAHGDDLVSHARLEGLEPSTTYFYRPRSGEGLLELPSTRSFTTAPPPDQLAEFSFAIVSDALSNDGDVGRSYESLALLSPAFVLQIGDLDHRDPGTTAPWDIQSWRQMHRDQLANYQAGQTLDRLVLAVAPFFHTWDDHDYGNDDANGTAQWKEMALGAFQEYFPLPPDAPNPEQGIWYSFRWAQAEIFMLDLRSQRSPSGDEDGEDKSMLDHFALEDGQKQWLKDGLAASTATWKIIVSSSCFNRYGKQVDSWALYQSEQRELLQHLVDHEVTGVFVISGDIHSGGGIDDGSFARLPEISVPATNINLSNCTGGYCGIWSEGIQEGDDPAGYAAVRISYDSTKGTHQASLETFSAAGAPRKRYVLEPGTAVVNQAPIRVEM